MTTRTSSHPISRSTLLALAIGLATTGAYADPPRDLFSDQGPAAAPEDQPRKVRSGKARKIALNLAALEADRLTIPLFEGETLIALRDRIVDDGSGPKTWIGHLENEPDSEVILTVHKRVMKGTVTRGEVAGKTTYEVVFKRGDVHLIRELDPKKKPPHVHPRTVSEADMAAAAASSPASAAAPTGAAPTGAQIDLLVVYSPQARINAGGVAGIETRIANAVAKTNQGYLNSQINMQLNLVKMQEVTYTETGDMGAALSALQSKTDGKMDNVHTLRDQFGADQVVLVTADQNYCGIAYQMTSLSTGFASWAFSVVHDDHTYNCMGGITLGHELGHNQGNAHDPQNSGAAGIYPYSYGYRVCGVFRDVMSYNCSGEQQINYFSNPNVFYNGNPTGIANAQDTASSMNSASQTVASFRPTAATTLPTAPSSLTALASSSNTNVTLTWTDNANNESGYKVQRSLDGSTWSEIAGLGANVTSFTDSGLTGATAYSYRVYAFNGIGNSDFSNTASVTTSVALVDSTPPTAKISKPADGSTVSGTVAIGVTGSDNVALKSLQLSIDGKLVSSTNTGAINYKWNTRKIARGTHTISAKATDTSNNQSSVSVSVTR